MKKAAESPLPGCAMQIKLLFFAQLAEQAGCDSTVVDAGHPGTPRQLLEQLERKLPKSLLDTLRFDTVMVSINKVLASWDDPLEEGDEVAFLPPFSGG